MTNAQENKPRDPLIGYMVIEDYAEDYSQWDGLIAYPDPEGANLYWQKTIKMIEHSAYLAIQAENEKLKQANLKLREGLEFYADGTNYEAIYEDDEMDLHRIIDREDVSFDEDDKYFGHAGKKSRAALSEASEILGDENV